MLNRASLIGRVGKDPELQNTKKGESVSFFSLATTEKWKDKTSGEQREATEWHNIVTFGKLSQIVQSFVKKGSLVYVSGKIVTRKYTDKDGIERYSTNINVDELKLLSGTKEKTEHQKKPDNFSSSDIDQFEDDIPF